VLRRVIGGGGGGGGGECDERRRRVKWRDKNTKKMEEYRSIRIDGISYNTKKK
jgi:hypothetical protein